MFESVAEVRGPYNDLDADEHDDRRNDPYAYENEFIAGTAAYTRRCNEEDDEQQQHEEDEQRREEEEEEQQRRSRR